VSPLIGGRGTGFCLSCLWPTRDFRSKQCWDCYVHSRGGVVKHKTPMKGSKPCLHCGKPTRAKLGYCDKCLNSKIKSCPDCDQLIQQRSERCFHCAMRTRVTEEYRAKIGKSTKRRYEDPAYRAKMGKIQKIVQNTPEARRRNSKSQKISHNRPEVREKMSRLMKISMNRPEVKEKISGSNSWNWRGGCFEPYSKEFNEMLKRQIRDRDDHLCQFPDCYLPENGKKHDVHHIDYNKKNHAPVNLITLCQSHHSKTTNSNHEHWTELFQELQKLRGIT